MAGEAGEAQAREPLVLIHGFSGVPLTWHPVLEALQRRHQVRNVTLAGHAGGASLPERTEPTVAALADALERELDEDGIDDAHLAGNSLGGWLALELAKRGRARSVVAIAPGGGWHAGDAEERRLERFFKRQHKLASLFDGREEALVSRPRLRRLIFRDVMEHGERVTSAQAARLLQGTLGCEIYLDFIESVMRDGPIADLDRVDAPVLIAWPARDRILPLERHAPRFRSEIEGAEFIVLENCGHVPMWDDPELIARTILDFTSRHARAPAPA